VSLWAPHCDQQVPDIVNIPQADAAFNLLFYTFKNGGVGTSSTDKKAFETPRWVKDHSLVDQSYQGFKVLVPQQRFWSGDIKVLDAVNGHRPA
jgi:hypothetical protein